MLTNVVFLDRDGVINKDSKAYVKNWSEFVFLQKSLLAIRQLCVNNFAVIVITNQSGINRGIIRQRDLDQIHRNMMASVRRAGGTITDIFYCPHRPDEKCACRKPKPGLIEQACLRHSIDLSSCVMVGDSEKDIECAIAAGCQCTILVKTGNGITAENMLLKRGIIPDHVCPDLYHAAEVIISKQSRQDLPHGYH